MCACFFVFPVLLDGLTLRVAISIFIHQMLFSSRERLKTQNTVTVRARKRPRPSGAKLEAARKTAARGARSAVVPKVYDIYVGVDESIGGKNRREEDGGEKRRGNKGS